MATRFGFPAIPTPNSVDIRILQTVVSNTRLRIEQLEAQLGIVQTTQQQTLQSGTGGLSALAQQIAALAARILVLENASATDIGTYIAGDTITVGSAVVPASSTTVVQADPSDPLRMFGVIGIALASVVAGQSIQVQRRGVVTIPSLSGLEVGRAIYADATGLTQTPEYEATALPVGVAVSSTQIFVAPDFPALQQAGFESGGEEFQNYMPVTYRMLQTLGSLESMINALPYQSGADPDMLVPVVIDGIAYVVTAGDIAALAGALADLVTMIDALPFSSGADPDMMVPVTLGGFGFRVTAAAIAALGGGTGGGLTYLFSTTPPVSPSEGDFWFQSDTGVKFTYVNDGTSSQWVEC